MGTPWADAVETHTAAVFFAGDKAYKLKKPVDLGFVDFSSTPKRRVACEDEVALNRRLAPDVYLGVADVVGPGNEPAEPLVVMRRMPASRRLSTLITGCSGDLEPALVQTARLIADFHERCAIHSRPWSPGSYDRVRSLWDQELQGLAQHAAGIIDNDAINRMRVHAQHYLRGRRALFDERLAAGRVRDGHGDLQADDIFILPDGPRVLDCLDFDEQLRIGDVLLDVAFLAMDLERLGAPTLARTFLDAYREFSAETHPASLEHFFIAYRANIRAKVACIRVAQGDVTAANAAKQLAQLCQEHLNAATTRMVLVGGLPGSGKTTLATELASRRGWVHLNSDVVRKELAGLAATPIPASDFGAGLYAPEITRRTYSTLLDRAATAIQRGESVVLDASWSDRDLREQARAVAQTTTALITELMCVVPEEVATRRLAARQHGPSDANPSIRHAMASGFGAWPKATSVCSDQPPSNAADAAAIAVDATTP